MSGVCAFCHVFPHSALGIPWNLQFVPLVLVELVVRKEKTEQLFVLKGEGRGRITGMEELFGRLRFDLSFWEFLLGCMEPLADRCLFQVVRISIRESVRVKGVLETHLHVGAHLKIETCLRNFTVGPIFIRVYINLTYICMLWVINCSGSSFHLMGWALWSSLYSLHQDLL